MDIAIIIGIGFMGFVAYNFMFGDKHDDKM